MVKQSASLSQLLKDLINSIWKKEEIKNMKLNLSSRAKVNSYFIIAQTNITN